MREIKKKKSIILTGIVPFPSSKRSKENNSLNSKKECLPEKASIIMLSIKPFSSFYNSNSYRSKSTCRNSWESHSQIISEL